MIFYYNSKVSNTFGVSYIAIIRFTKEINLRKKIDLIELRYKNRSSFKLIPWVMIIFNKQLKNGVDNVLEIVEAV